MSSTDEISRWFVCSSCDREVRDPYAEVHQGTLFGECGCGSGLRKEVA
jgi:hypothetical protein